MVRILFVCSGNICRSPTAEGVFRDLVRGQGLEGKIAIDSAGTHGFHAGEPPDARSQAAARARGHAIGDLRARQVRADDFTTFDLILAMDRGHLRELTAQAPTAADAAKIRLFMTFAPSFGTDDVPDPYYGAGDGFERVLDMIETGSEGLLAHLHTLWDES